MVVFRSCNDYTIGTSNFVVKKAQLEAVYLCGITATPPNAEIHKTALGGEDSVDWRYFERTEDAIEELHRQGVFVYSVEQVEGSTKLQELNTENPTSHQHPTPNTQHPPPLSTKYRRRRRPPATR